jgi:hypothetical protein
VLYLKSQRYLFGARLPLYGTGSKHQCRHGDHNSGKSKTQRAVDGSLQVSSNPLTHSKSQNELNCVGFVKKMHPHNHICAVRMETLDSFEAHLAALAAEGKMKDYIPVCLEMRLRRLPTVVFRIPGSGPTTVTADWESMLSLRGLPLTLRGLTEYVGGDYEKIMLWAPLYS